MLNLIKGNILRLLKNMIYLGGCVISFFVTYYFTMSRPVAFMARWSENCIMIFVSAATILYFSFFTGLFVGTEYSDGVIRNKMIAGHSQLKIYVSDYLSLVLAMIFMFVMWLMGGILGGGRLNRELCVYTIVALCYNAAYIAIMMAISFRIKKQVFSVIAGMGIFYFMTNMVLLGNFFVSSLDGVVQKIAAVFYSMNVFGQYFIHLGLMDEGADLGLGVRLFLSLLILVIASLAGTMELKNRDVK